MHTFIFFTGMQVELSNAMLCACSQNIKQYINSFGEAIVEKNTLLPEKKWGWVWLEPAKKSSYRLFSEAINERYAVLLFGSIPSDKQENPAQIVLQTWSSAGAVATQALEGSFGTVIVDRLEDTVTLLSDVIGQRSLRYYTDHEFLIVSPHDISIVATGRCPLAFDMGTAASLAGVSWSLGGKSLLKTINACYPTAYVQYQHGHIQTVSMPLVGNVHRLSPHDSLSIGENLDHMVAVAQENIKQVVTPGKPITAELSSGLDSRAILSLLLSVLPRNQISAWSVGASNDRDVMIARQLARLCRIDFSHAVLSSAPTDSFVAHSDLLTFATNGNANVMDIALKPMPLFDPAPSLSFCGDAGEIFRGYYYPHGHRPHQRSISASDALSSLQRRIIITPLPWISLELEQIVRERLAAILGEYATVSTDGYDLLDMFYLYERFAVWCNKHERSTWEAPIRVSPFASRSLVRLAYKMPAPIADYARIHEEFIRRFAPLTAWLRINGDTRLPLEGDRWITDFLRKLDNKLTHIQQRIASQLQQRVWGDRWNAGDKSYNELREDALATEPLWDVIHNLLLAGNSLAIEMFGQNGTEQLLHNLKEPRGELQRHECAVIISRLVSVERFRTTAQAIAKNVYSLV